jgi:hypothetical protein
MYQLPEELNLKSHEAGIALIRIRERVLDDGLRLELEALHRFAVDVEPLSIQLRDTEPSAVIRQLDAASAELVERHERVNKQLGAALRTILGR